MVKRRTSGIIVGVIVIVMFLLLLLLTQPFTLLGEEIWLPRYYTGQCIPRADNLAEIQILSHTDEGRFYHCTTQEAGKWVPLVNGVECEYTITGQLTASVYICDGITENPEDFKTSKCSDERKIFREDRETFVVNAGDTIFINTNKIIGDARLFAKYPSYGIMYESPDGFKTSTSTNCLAQGIDNKYHTLNLNSRLEILPDVPFNSVVGLQRAYSTQAVTLSDVENGAPIYIIKPGYYYRIKTAEDGFKYVDTAGPQLSSTKIECVPRTTGCSDDAKIIPLLDQSCDKFGGAITDYAPVQGDSTRLCKYSCKDGTLKLTSDCIEVVKDCPTDKPLWDGATGKCVGLTVPQDEEYDPIDPLLIFLIGGFVLVILVMLVVKRKMKRRKK